MSAVAQTAVPQSTDYSLAQARFCELRGVPHFAPDRCYSCGKNIYSHARAQHDAAVVLITGCPFCHHSFVE